MLQSSQKLICLTITLTAALFLVAKFASAQDITSNLVAHWTLDDGSP